MSFLKLRLAIEKAIRAEEQNASTARIRIAIVGQEQDNTVKVYIDPPMKVDGLTAQNEFVGSPADLEFAFIEHWTNRGSAYHLKDASKQDIQFGIFTPDEFQQLQSSSSSSSTLTGYSQSTKKPGNLSNFPQEKFNLNINRLNTLLWALQFYVSTLRNSEKFSFQYYPEVSGSPSRLTAAVQIINEKPDNDLLPQFRVTSEKFASHLAREKFGFSPATGPISRKEEYTLKGNSEQNIQLKLDASQPSLDIMEKVILFECLHYILGLDSGNLFIPYTEYDLSKPIHGEGPDLLFWRLRFLQTYSPLVDATERMNPSLPLALTKRDTELNILIEFLNKIGFTDKSIEYTTDNPPLGRLEYTLQEDKYTKEPQIKLSASPETFLKITEALWANQPNPKNKQQIW